MYGLPEVTEPPIPVVSALKQSDAILPDWYDDIPLD
jgi:hypothetical protein